jgi:hypothetical protein
LPKSALSASRQLSLSSYPPGPSARSCKPCRPCGASI